jgi:hypothetical protein
MLSAVSMILWCDAWKPRSHLLSGASRSSFLGNGHLTASVPAATNTLESVAETAKQNLSRRRLLDQWFSIVVRPRPGNFSFYRTMSRYNWCQDMVPAEARRLRNTVLDRPNVEYNSPRRQMFSTEVQMWRHNTTAHESRKKNQNMRKFQKTRGARCRQQWGVRYSEGVECVNCYNRV